MRTRVKKFAMVVGAIVTVYFCAYALSVEVNYAQIKAVYVAVPHYRPWDSGLVHSAFAPAQANALAG